MVEQTYQFFDFFWGTSVMGATSPSNPCANCSSCVAILESLIACSMHTWSQKDQRAFSSEPSQAFICECSPSGHACSSTRYTSPSCTCCGIFVCQSSWHHSTCAEASSTPASTSTIAPFNADDTRASAPAAISLQMGSLISQTYLCTT